MKKATTAISLSLLALGACMTAGAAESQGTQQPQQQAAATDSMVAIDPATGRLRPVTQAEAAELSQKAAAMRPASRSAARAAVSSWDQPVSSGMSVLPNGTRSKRVPPEAISALTAVRNADGSLNVDESEHPRQARTEVSE